MKLILGVLCSLLLASCATNKVEVLPPPTAKELICKQTEWEGCLDVDDPIKVISNVVNSAYYGFYYPGEPYIFINKYLSKSMTWRTEIHETVHYMSHELEREEGDTRCKSEELARVVTAKILNLTYDDSWRDRYACHGGKVYKPQAKEKII